MVKSTNMTINFRHRFDLKGLGTALPPGDYDVEIEEEQIEGLSFLAYRRLATSIRMPVPGHGRGSSQIFPVDAKELERALERDAVVDAAAR